MVRSSSFLLVFVGAAGAAAGAAGAAGAAAAAGPAAATALASVALISAFITFTAALASTFAAALEIASSCAASGFANMAFVLDVIGLASIETASSCGVGNSTKAAGAFFILDDFIVKPFPGGADIYIMSLLFHTAFNALSFSKAIRLAACSASGLFLAVASAITLPCISKTPIVKTLSCGGPSAFTSMYLGGW